MGPRLLRWAERHGASVSAAWRVLQPTVAGDGDRTCHATERLVEGMAPESNENDGDIFRDIMGWSYGYGHLMTFMEPMDIIVTFVLKVFSCI